ncbi:MAG: hypothetical protein H6737_16115 [Alphaproteobacteria bacterium]|nr:hypothetical protein [Alphaproteobacteria bacterium]
MRLLAVGIALLGALAPAAALAHPEDDGSGRFVEIVVDLADRSDGWLSVTAMFHELDRRDLAFRQLGTDKEITFSDVTFEGVSGPIAATRDGSLWNLANVPADGPITLKWRVKPGGIGRHGHQGWVQGDWASFDGRILLLPTTRRSLRTAKIRIERPDGWSVVHPYVEKDGWMVLHDHNHLKSVLTATCVAVGDYDIRSEQIGETDFRVGAPRAWDAAWRDTLFEKSFAEMRWFHDTLGYDRHGPFAIAWLPEAEGGKVFGGASVNGACYEHPRETPRNWLLLGHRIGHPMNKYAPSGMTLRDDRDHWFMEGWASYIEIVAAAKSGALPDERHWNTLWRRHLREIAKHPEHDVALADELQHTGAFEYLHYTKGPMVVRHLDLLMRQRSGTDLEAFMKAMWAKYGFHRNVFPLREEIEAFTGDDYDDFWAVFVDRPGTPFPTWPEMVDPQLEARMNDAAAAYVGDVPVHPELLFWLAWSGRFERFAEIEQFVIEGVHAQQMLASRELHLLPATVEPLQFALPGEAQAAVLETAMAWDLDALPRQRSGCWSSPDPARPAIRYTDSADGKVFTQLLELERAYEAKLGEIVARVDIKVPNTPTRNAARLGVSPGEPLVLHAFWNAAPPRAGFELWAGGQQVHTKQLTIDPSWVNTHVGFEVGDRPGDASILVFKVGPDTVPAVERPIWQRQAPFARGPGPQRPSGEREDDDEVEGEVPSEAGD